MIEEQDALRAFDPYMPPGAAMIDEYFAQAVEACRQCDGSIFLAVANDEIVGFVTILTRIPHETADDGPGTYAAVMDLAVRPSRRGRGIGAALLRRAEDRARAAGAPDLRLHVLTENGGAVDLYRRLGFGR